MATKRAREETGDGSGSESSDDGQPWSRATRRVDGNTKAVPRAAEERGALRPSAKVVPAKCPYLDTVDRSVLDFDFEKVCSVTLDNRNVYGCLVCGRFFAGRGQKTPAFTHSVEVSHHVFINLEDGRVYCLPDNYEVADASLQDIKLALSPRFTAAEIEAMDASDALATDVLGVPYLPGYVGLNSLANSTDYANVVLQALAHVTPMRNFFLDASRTSACTSPVVQRYGELVRKMWSPRNFKATVSPHEFMQVVSTASKKRFRIGQQSESMEFISWLLNTLHLGLAKSYAKIPGVRTKPKGASGSSKKGSSVVQDSFQGVVELHVQREVEDDEGAAGAGESKETVEESTKAVPFRFLSLELPPVPLFKDSGGSNVIPQIGLASLLRKFDGRSVNTVLTAGARERRRYRLAELPPYLLLHIKRFTKNNFFVEKNPTIVTFPIQGLDLSPYLTEEARKKLAEQQAALPTDLSSASVKELRAVLARAGKTDGGVVDKTELVARARGALREVAASCSTRYDLIANICHDSPPERERGAGTGPRRKGKAKADATAAPTGKYRVHVRCDATGQWYAIQDLHVESVMAADIAVSESYALLYRRVPAPRHALEARGGSGSGDAEMS